MFDKLKNIFSNRAKSLEIENNHLLTEFCTDIGDHVQKANFGLYASVLTIKSKVMLSDLLLFSKGHSLSVKLIKKFKTSIIKCHIDRTVCHVES